MDPIRTILVPVDFDAASEAAVQRAVGLAQKLGSRVVLLHVVPFSLTDVPEEFFYTSPNASQRNRADRGTKLSALRQSLAGSGVDIVTDMGEGIAWDAILGAAQRHEADLIVMGAHGGSRLSRGLLGSVAERVVRTAPIPVMTVRAKAA
jgi:nucleotide-binding universal stress UspA family protein